MNAAPGTRTRRLMAGGAKASNVNLGQGSPLCPTTVKELTP
jgi:hypothetical protein